MKRSTELDLFFDDFAYKMRCARKAKRLTQENAAKAAGITAEAIRRIEYAGNCYVFTALLLMQVYGMHPSDIDTLGKRLQFQRKIRCKTQKELAKEAGLSLHGLRLIEWGKSFPAMDTLVMISKALDIDPWTFLEA